MKNYFFNLNKKYLQTFKINVQRRFNETFIKNNESFLRLIFREINELFRHLGGRTSSKKDIPRKGEYPDAEIYNRLINSIDDDIDKLYTAQRLIVDDLNNLIKFNSNQRATTFEELMEAQQRILELQIKNKKDVTGQFIVENEFQSSESLSTDSSNVYIDETRGILTLSSTFDENKPIDTDNISIYFAGRKPTPPIYPNNRALRTGSHWRIPGEPEEHFVDTSNPSIDRSYRNMMIDTPNNNRGVGWVEFEAVLTELVGHIKSVDRTQYSFVDGGRISSESFIPSVKTTFTSKNLHALKEEISKIGGFNKDPQLIYVDIPYSLQGMNDYVKLINFPDINTSQEEKYKIDIPFVNAKLTNEVAIQFSPIEGDIPMIIWEESVAYSNINGREVAYPIIEPSDTNAQSDDGYYICKFNSYMIPSRVQLMVTFGGDPWHQIPFQMTHYIYTIQNQYDLPQLDSDVSFFFKKEFDIFVDSEPNKDREQDRAINVLSGIK